MRYVFVIVLSFLLVGSFPVGGVQAQDAALARLIAQLDHEDFEQRNTAQMSLVAIGDQALRAVRLDVIRADAPDEDFQKHLAAMEQRLRDAADDELLQYLQNLDSYEARYRAKNVRAALEVTIAERLNEVRRQHPTPLPDAERRRVQGVTGGFREKEPWFDAEFRNESSYTVTGVRILVRTTNAKTGLKREQVLRFNQLEAPLPPQTRAKWSAPVGFVREDGDNFYWEWVDVLGYPTVPTTKKES